MKPAGRLPDLPDRTATAALAGSAAGTPDIVGMSGASILLYDGMALKIQPDGPQADWEKLRYDLLLDELF